MRKLLRKIMCLSLVLLLSFEITSNNALAGTGVPTSEQDISNSSYSGSGECNTVDLYSNKLFTGVGKLKISVTNKGKNKFTVKVYRRDDAHWYSIDNKIHTMTVPKSGNASVTLSVAKSARYYVKFEPKAKFSYKVKKG